MPAPASGLRETPNPPAAGAGAATVGDDGSAGDGSIEPEGLASLAGASRAEPPRTLVERRGAAESVAARPATLEAAPAAPLLLAIPEGDSSLFPVLAWPGREVTLGAALGVAEPASETLTLLRGGKGATCTRMLAASSVGLAGCVAEAVGGLALSLPSSLKLCARSPCFAERGRSRRGSTSEAEGTGGRFGIGIVAGACEPTLGAGAALLGLGRLARGAPGAGLDAEAGALPGVPAAGLPATARPSVALLELAAPVEPPGAVPWAWACGLLTLSRAGEEGAGGTESASEAPGLREGIWSCSARITQKAATTAPPPAHTARGSPVLRSENGASPAPAALVSLAAMPFAALGGLQKFHRGRGWRTPGARTSGVTADEEIRLGWAAVAAALRASSVRMRARRSDGGASVGSSASTCRALRSSAKSRRQSSQL